ncbi:MAG: NUDIX domain-containing protein [Candidatus Moranbacteria bacterium]|nr:NUDIX domain-containing protein [Candidatus Moranbacteria bacterium]
MNQPTISGIDQIRNGGFRPQIVGCFLHDKKILFFYKREYDLWQLPQGGIDNGEDIEIAFFREMREEIGSEFIEVCDKNISLFGEDKVEFPAHSQDSRELKNDAGKVIFMKGKKYFFVFVNTDTNAIDISQSEFDDFKWVSFEEGLVLCEKMQQKGKKRITLGALEKLRDLGLL